MQRFHKSVSGISTFADLVEFVADELEYESVSEQLAEGDFWNGAGRSQLLATEEGREVVRLTQIPEDGKPFNEVKRHLRQRGADGREVLNIVAYTEEKSNVKSKITSDIHFMYLASSVGEEAGIDYDLKYFSIDPENPKPVYYEYLEGVRVNNRDVEDLEDEDSDKALLETFSVERITKNFYSDFHDLIEDRLEPSISNLPEDVEEEHYAQLLTNRVLFILFIQEKRWLGVNPESNEGDADYLETKYAEARDSDEVDLWNDFFQKLFFEGLNQRGDSPEIVGTVPYLNGGLFEKRDYEDQVEVDSDFFEALLSPEKKNDFGRKEGFLKNYRISLSESNPSEQELVVDPEFIGRVFEMSMQDTEERGEKGAFYTPKDITQ